MMRAKYRWIEERKTLHSNLAQVLVASTYPLEIIQLQQWMNKNPDLEGDALADAVAEQPWDPSIQSMAVVPEAVDRRHYLDRHDRFKQHRICFFGTLAEGYAGYAYITGYPGQPPLLPGFGLADDTSGLMGAFLAMVALQEKNRSGKGQVVDFGIYEPLFTLLGPQVVDYDQLGIIQERNGSRLPFTAPRNTYRTKDDKWVSISGSAQSTFERMCDALGIPDIPNDPRFLDNRLRIQNAPALDESLQTAIEKFDREDLLALFERFDATAAPCNNIKEIF